MAAHRPPRDHTYASGCYRTLDGGKTWENFTPRKKPGRVRIERDAQGKFIVVDTKPR